MTQETEDMVGRLRLFGSARPQLGLPVCDEAADLLERLSDRIDVLEGALRECFGTACDYTIKEREARSEIAKQARAALHQEGIDG